MMTKPHMKNLTVSLFFAFSLILNTAGPSAEELALAKARNSGAEAKECLRVVDQDGIPVACAKGGERSKWERKGRS